MFRRYLAVGVIMAVISTMTGCGIVSPAFGCVPSNGGDDKTGTEYLNAFIQGCKLAPSDTYMIDLYDFLRQDLAGKNRSQVRQMLTDYREQHGDDLRFLEDNPSLGQPEAGYDDLHFVFLSLTRYVPGVVPVVPDIEILVDAETMSVNFISQSRLLGDLDAGTVHVFPNPHRNELIGLLNSRVSFWHDSYPIYPATETETTPYENWVLSVCLNDDSLHSFRAIGLQGNIPTDFQDFVDSFLQITGTTW